MFQRMTREEFIKRASKIHENKYDYSLVDYQGWNSIIRVICPIHGEFNQVSNDHLQGHGCRKCGVIKYSSKRRLPQEYFVERARKVHGNKYDYSLVEYKKEKDRVKIVCPFHGEFDQAPHNHLQGHGCLECGNMEIASKKRMPREDFINRANSIHSNKYDYSLVEYKNSATKIRIICPIHGEYHQIPAIHLKGSGCPLCGKVLISQKLSYTGEEFITEAGSVHGAKYDYSLVDYKGIFYKVRINCPVHGEFSQDPHTHLSGSGCPKCKGDFISKKFTKSFENFRKKAEAVHGRKRYDYSKAVYKNRKKKIEIICSQHGSFYQKPDKHLAGHGCTACSVATGAFKIKDTTASFIVKAENIHGMKYEYASVDYKSSSTKIQIGCPKHGPFMQTPESHLAGRGCPKCNEPFGERLINRYFQKHGILCECQKKFEECKNKRCLPFDFFVPRLNLCVEYDGKQHFVPYARYGDGEGFEALKKRDAIKSQFCQDNGIRLIRIPYFMPKPEIRATLDTIKAEFDKST